MDLTLRLAFAAMSFALLAFGHQAHAQSTESYSQPALLKNWALSVCLATVAKDAADRQDANATASAYLEFGHQPIEAYDKLRALAEQYASKKYGGSIQSDFNTMKCIDLFHSKELNDLAGKLSRRK
jgi:hypothetical protein